MRIWSIHPAYLDQKRLISAHNELHTCRSCIRVKRRWGMAVELYKNSVHVLEEKHRVIVEEIAYRDPLRGTLREDILISTHPSPFEGPESDEERSVNIHTTMEMEQADVRELRSKWEAEYYYHGTGRKDLRELEEALGLPVGPSMAEAQARQQSILAKMKFYDPWFIAYRKVWPKSRIQDRILAFLHGEVTGENAVRYVLEGYQQAWEEKTPDQMVQEFLIGKMEEIRGFPSEPAPPPGDIVVEEFEDVVRHVTATQHSYEMHRISQEVIQQDAGQPVKRKTTILPAHTLEAEWAHFNAAPVVRHDRRTFRAAGQTHPNFPEPGDTLYPPPQLQVQDLQATPNNQRRRYPIPRNPEAGVTADNPVMLRGPRETGVWPFPQEETDLEDTEELEEETPTGRFIYDPTVQVPHFPDMDEELERLEETPLPPPVPRPRRRRFIRR